MENERVMNDGLHLFVVYGSLFMCSLSSSVGCQMPENKLELTVSAPDPTQAELEDRESLRVI